MLAVSESEVVRRGFEALGALVTLFAAVAAPWAATRRRAPRTRAVLARHSAVPSEIHLEGDPTPGWLAEEDLRPLLDELAACGFRLGVAYVIREFPHIRLCSLWLDDAPMLGALRRDPEFGDSIALAARFASGREIVVTNSCFGGNLEPCPGNETAWLHGESVAEVLSCFRAKAAGEASAPVMSLDEAGSCREYEGSHWRDMKWRNARGGLNLKEFRAIVAALGRSLSLDQEREAFFARKRAELGQRRYECLMEARRIGLVEPDGPLKIDGRFPFIVADMLYGPAFVEYASEMLGLPLPTEKRCATFAAEVQSNAVLLSRLAAGLPAARQPRKSGEVSAPIAAEIWTVPGR